MAIDIGAEATDRDYFLSALYTVIVKDNPANASGTITSVEIWASTDLGGAIVGTFYTTNGNTLKCRDSATIGTVTGGSKQTFTEDSESAPLAISVEAGDYIGIYFTTAIEGIEMDIEGFAGIWYLYEEQIDPNDEATYDFLAGYTISLYGYGDIAPPVYTPRHSGTVGVLMI